MPTGQLEPTSSRCYSLTSCLETAPGHLSFVSYPPGGSWRRSENGYIKPSCNFTRV